MTLPVLHSLMALLLAHTLADFVFQTKWMVAHKRRIPVLALHIFTVIALSFGALGGAWQVALMAGLAHLVIDAMKLAAPAPWRATAWLFLADQIAHVLTLGCLALAFPMVFAAGLWAPYATYLMPAAIILTGFMITVLAGGHVVGLLTAGFTPTGGTDPDEGLVRAGRMIGQLERTLIFLLLCVDQPAGIGFLIAAKSILRFEAGNKLQASEYVIIGTLASFGWALGAGYATMSLLEVAATLP